MRKPRFALRFALLTALALVLAVPAHAETAPPAETPQPSPAPAAETVADGEQIVYIGEVATRVEGAWEGGVTFAVGSSSPKTYAAMTGNVLRLTLYSTVPEDVASAFYLPMDSHISYIDGSDRFAMTGRSGRYYCYEKEVRVTAGGDFSLAVANTNGTLYSGLFDTVAIHAYDSIETLDFFAEQRADDTHVTDFFVTANGSATALITPDTLGFNATDNEWKIVTADNAERVLFSDTVYGAYHFDPRTISLSIRADDAAAGAPAAFQVYYLGLINGRLFTVGPYAYPASASTYSSTFELARSVVDMLATENTVTVYAYIDAGRRPDLTVAEARGRVSLADVRAVESDRDGLDKLAITLDVRDTADDLDVLIGNRWSSNEIAYNYRTLRLNFLREIQSVSLTAVQNGHYNVVYTATVNGQQELDTTAVNWYINDALQPEHGLVLDHTYNEGGHYTVYAELGGLHSNAVTSTIIFTSWQANLWYTVLAVVLAVAVVYLLHNRHRRGARLDAVIRAHLQRLLAHAESDHLALLQGRIAPRRVVRMLGRGGHLTDLRSQLMARYRATNMAAYDQALQALNTARADLRRASRRRADDPYYVRALLTTYHANLQKALDALEDIAALAMR